MAAPASKSYYFHHTNSSAAGENSGATSSAFSNKTTRGKTTAATNNSGTTISSTTAVLTESCYNSTSSCSTSTLLHNNIVNSTCDDVNALMMNSTGGHDQLVEREVAEDAQWKRIQQNTFTRWANQHLKEVGCSIQNLETDLSDGLLLIRLVEILSHKRLPKHSKRPQFRSQKLENVSVAINFLENVEKIKLVNIDSSDIVDQRLKLILGLIWTLILHYSISMPMLDEDMNGSATETAIKETPKQRLLGWIQAKIPDVSVTNFTSDWQNGRALGALVESVAPGLASDWPTWSKRDALENTTHAMNLADNWLGVAKLIEPHEMINPKVDEMSVMTYLSQYPNARLKPGAPIGVTKAKSDPQRVRAYGPGIQPNGVKSGSVTHFTVDAQQPGPASVSCFIRNPAGQFEPVEITTNNEKSSHYTVTYAPQMQGPHQVIVKYNNFEIPGSPFPVSVESAAPVASDVSKVTVAGPGVEPGVMTEKPTYFEIYTKDNTGALPEVVVLPPSGSAAQPLQPPIRRISDNVYRCEYVASEPGLHSLNVLYANQHIPCSPVGVTVLPSVDPRNVRCWGRGVQPKGIRVGDRADFKVYTDGAGDGQLDVKVKTPTGLQERVERRDTDATTSAFGYQPKTTGVYTVDVTYGGHPVPKSPFKVSVAADVPSLIRAYGPGLETGVANLPCEFSVETNGETGSLGFSVEGPSQAKISCKDNGDGSAEISYLPTTAGDYAVHVLCNDEDIPGSPYMVNVQPYHEGFMPSMVRCSGPGLERKGVLKGQTAPFFVDAQNAGKAPLKVVGLDRDYDPVPVEVKDNQNGTFSCCYEPKTATPHTIQISYGGVAVPGSPYRVFVQEPVDPTKVKVFGPGVETGVKSKTPTHFIIDCKQAGPGEVEVALSDDKGAAVDIDVLDNSDGSFTVKYTAPKPGPYNVRVVFAHSEIPGSPIRLNVQPHLDVGGIRVEGLDTKVFVDSTTEFIVDVRSVPRPTGPNKLVCLVTTPEKKLVQAHVDDRFDGTYLVSYTPFDPGSYNVEILFDNIPLSSTPYTVLALEGSDARRVRAHGTGLARGLVGIPGQFVVETKGAGRETVDVSLVGPKEANMNCTENANSSCVFEYVPIESGKYEISIKFGGKDIPGSPFFVLVDYPVDAAKVFATGPGLEPKNCRSGVPLTFQVDASKSGYAPLNVDVLSERGPAIKLPEIRERPNNNYEVVFYPTAEGSTCTVHVTYGGKEIANSPFRMLVLPAFEPQKVLVRGDGIIPLGHIPASVPVSFTVDTTNAGDADMEVLVVGPDSEPVPVKVVDHGDGTYLVSWVPEDTGKYSILVKYGGREVPRSPYKLTSYAVGDASKCVIKSRQENIVIGEEYGIVVDTAHAGEGNITCRIRPNHPHSTLLKVDVDKQQNGTVGIYYTAPNPDQYLITIKFGGRPIPGGEFKVWADTREAIAAAAASRPVVNGHDREHSNFQNGFELPPVEFWNIALPPNSGTKSCSKIEAHVLLPSRKLDFPDIKENQDGSVTVKYQPMEKGLHEMHIKHNGSHVQGSPYQFFVESAHENYVTAYGSGLVYGSVGEKAQFTVSAKQSSTSVAGIEDGGLSVSIEGPAKADITCQDNKDGTCTVSWVPPVAGEYKIHVRFGDSEITGSPFTAKISGDADSRKRAHFAVESRNEVSLKISEADTTDLTATISSPSGVELPCSIRKMDDGHLASGAGDAGISFTPREVGEHLVSVQKGGKLLPASPFQIQISQSEVASAAKVKTTGSGLNTATAKQFNDVFVDTRGAGFGGLSLSIEGPSKCEIRCEDNKDGTCNIQYRPSEPGNYILNLKFADTHVPGSPFNINCQGTVSDNVKETVKHQRKQTTVVAAGQECELCLRITDADVRSMRAQLTSPSGLTRDAEVVPVDRNTVCVRFRPSELGVHTVAVQHKAQQLPGSPFQFTVGPFADGGAEKVRAGGQGLVHGEVNQPASFNIYTREAGAGNLSIAIEGPSKAEIDFKDHKDGNCYVVYTVSKLGTYTVNVKFDDKHIPGSPFKSYISPKPPMVNGSNGHNNRLPEVLFCPPTAILNHPLRFNVATAAKNGSIIDAKVIAPSGAESSCDVSTVGADVYEVGFTPRDTGNHYVHVKVDGNHLPESPILVVVRDDIPDSKQVLVSGQGIKEGFIGKQCEFVINTCNAGPGSLQVTVEGPSKVSLDAVEVEEGYKLRYTPLAPGNYTIIIKYNGEHIPGSPFQTTVDGKLTRSPVGVRESSTFQVSTLSPTNLPTSNLPTTSKLPPSTTSKAPPKEIKDDAARKVVCTGSGLQRAVVGSQNHFTVDTSNAGSDLLWISVVSSRGPIDEVFVKHLGNGLFSVNYLLSERQPCFVYIKLGDKHVPGSPFEVGV